MVAKTGNTYISEIMTDTVEIPTANLGFSIVMSRQVSLSECEKWKDSRSKQLYCHFRLSVVVAVA